jgi:hypothetical protein
VKTKSQEQAEINTRLADFERGWQDAIKGISAKEGEPVDYALGWERGLSACKIDCVSYRNNLENTMRLQRGEPITAEHTLAITKHLRTLGPGENK